MADPGQQGTVLSNIGTCDWDGRVDRIRFAIDARSRIDWWFFKQLIDQRWLSGLTLRLGCLGDGPARSDDQDDRSVQTPQKELPSYPVCSRNEIRGRVIWKGHRSARQGWIHFRLLSTSAAAGLSVVEQVHGSGLRCEGRSSRWEFAGSGEFPKGASLAGWNIACA